MEDRVNCKYLEYILPGRIRLSEPMKLHTTWRIGGPADFFVEPEGEKELSEVLDFAHHYRLPVTVIGNGSNLLVRDRGIRGVVIKIGKGFAKIKTEGNKITSGAGVNLSYLMKTALEAGIGGLEFIAGIPGSVGGAVVMNAGIKGITMSDVVENVLVMNNTGQVIQYRAEELEFGYRTSKLKDAPLIVLEAGCRGSFCDSQIILFRVRENLNRRKQTQPYAQPSAGSVFKNPPGESAGYLIDQIGGKGMRVGEAAVSDVHANFIVNLGTATARDVLELISRIQELVSRQYGIKLALEVQVLGED